jgi:hypothetical protein
MKRDYTDGVSEQVELFTGREVEETPAYGLKTLFVVGIHSPLVLIDRARELDCTHIYLGANQSFNPSERDHWEDWDDMISVLLDEGWLVTLDYDHMYHSKVIDMGYNEESNFISQISVKIPHIDALNYNACIKIDDTDFKATNPGVWVHRVHDLKSPSNFTDWREYTKDKPIKDLDNN